MCYAYRRSAKEGIPKRIVDDYSVIGAGRDSWRRINRHYDRALRYHRTGGKELAKCWVAGARLQL